jgi:plastocyanin
MRRWTKVGCAVVLVGGTVGTIGVGGTAHAAAPVVQVEVGGFIDGHPEIDLQGMYPNVTTIHAGDSVAFEFRGFHNVAFRASGQREPLLVPTDPPGTVGTVLDAAGQAFWFSNTVPTLRVNPGIAAPTGNTSFDGSTDVNSGLPLGPGAPTVVSFPKAGTFAYFCEIHPFMQGTVDVKPAGVRVPRPSTLVARGVVETERDAARALAHERELIEETKPEHGDDDGAKVIVGDGTKRYSFDAFFPATSSVHVGERVKFVWRGWNEVHTVTFGPEALRQHLEDTLLGDPPVATPINPQGAFSSEPPAGPPGSPAAGMPQHIVVSPTTHGDGFANSGILFDPPAGPAPHSFTVRFSAPGTYNLECLIHPGMDATVVVRL